MKFEKTGDPYWDKFGRMPKILAVSFWVLGVCGAVLFIWLAVLVGQFFGWW